MPINGFPGQVISATAPTVSTAGATGIWGLDEQLQYAGQNLWPGYQISRSVRLRSSASANFSRTPASASNRTTWTWSGWAKIGTIGTAKTFFDACNTDENNEFQFQINASNVLVIQQTVGGTTSGQISCTTNAVFRDPSAWYHLVLSVDTGNATSTNRIRVFVNGVQQTFATYTANSVNTWINFNSSHTIGRQAPPNSGFFDGYLTEINFIDGQALTPASFGYADTATGVWQPLPYTGTYGTNGFYLNFSDNSAATAAAIGKDYSGNGNNWTPNNISVTAGVTYDSMVDSPTPYGSDSGVGGEVRGNYCTLNPLDISGGTVSNGNLTYVGPNFIRGTITPISGKYYWEVTVDSVGAGNCDIGLFKQSIPLSATTNRIEYRNDGNKVSDGSVVAYGATYTTNNIIGVAADFDNGTITFYKNNASQGTITYGSIVGYSPHSYCGTSFGHTYNFGQRAFAYTAPSGYQALCTQNFSTPTIANGASYMAATLYAGNNATQTIANTANNTSFQPDFVWQKNRSSAANNILVDSVRGGSVYLISNSTSADLSAPGYMTFNSNGATFSSSDIATNQSGQNYVAWQWQAGKGTTSSNTNGSITSTVSVNQTAGFSVVTFTTQASSTGTFGHGLGVAPSMVILKLRGISNDWNVYHTSIGATKYLYLDTTAAAGTSTAVWNDTTPTSTVVTLGTSWAGSYTAVAYCFAAIAGYSAFGSYTGNGSTDGPFVFCGFRPRWVMIKRYGDGTNNWEVRDTSRDLYNTVDDRLFPNTSAAEDANNEGVDFLSNGFKIRNAGTGSNASGASYIYAAFAENPTKYARAR